MAAVVTELGTKLLSEENSKAQDLAVDTAVPVTKDLSEQGFTVKQGATTSHEDSATADS